MTEWDSIQTAPCGKIVIVGRGKMWAQAIFIGERWRHAHCLDELCFDPTHWMLPLAQAGVTEGRDALAARGAEGE